MKLDPDIFIHVSVHNNFIDYCSQLEYDALNSNNIFILEDQENCIHKLFDKISMHKILNITGYQNKHKVLRSYIYSDNTILETIDHKIYKYLVTIK